MNKIIAKIYRNYILIIMLIIVYTKQKKGSKEEQNLVFECAHCGRVFSEFNDVFFGSRLFNLARNKDKALLEFVSILNDMGNELTKRSSNFDSLEEILCFCET